MNAGLPKVDCLSNCLSNLCSDADNRLCCAGHNQYQQGELRARRRQRDPHTCKNACRGEQTFIAPTCVSSADVLIVIAVRPLCAFGTERHQWQQLVNFVQFPAVVHGSWASGQPRLDVRLKAQHPARAGMQLNLRSVDVKPLQVFSFLTRVSISLIQKGS